MKMFLTAWVLLGAAALAPAQVVINEFSYDDTGTDDWEFVELYNAGPLPVDIGGWRLEGADEAWTGPFTGDNNPDYTIPLGTTLAPGAFYVIGAAGVPNLNLSVGTVNLWENDKEAIVLRDATDAVIDAVGYETNKATTLNASLYEGGGIWGNFTGADTLRTSWSRWRDGLDTNDNGRDFGLRPWTPGTTNNLPPVHCYEEDFDSHPVLSFPPGWSGTFTPPRVVDPTVAGGAGNIVNAVPASPQGGRALAAWDPAGGGNQCIFLTDGRSSYEFEAYVYVFTGHVGADFEQWSIGVCGTTDTFYNYPVSSVSWDPAVSQENGNTGVVWTLVTRAGSTTLNLVDERSGGVQSVISTFTIIPGQNDGWQRIRLRVDGSLVTGGFGGNLGDPASGASVTTSIPGTRFGGVWLGYRENAPTSGIANVRPLLLDAVRIKTLDIQFQTNQVTARFQLDDALTPLSCPARLTRSVNDSVLYRFQSTLVGNAWDVGITYGAPLKAANAGGVVTPGGQIINLDLAASPVWLFGGAAPSLTTPFPAPIVAAYFNLPGPTGLLSAQMVVFDPTHPDGFHLSQGTELTVQ
jgi:hypothetical protein